MTDQLAAEISKWLQANCSPGERLRELRQSRGFTQQDMASKLGCSDNIISRIERDEQPFRDVKEVLRFTSALDCTELEKAELIESFLYTQTRISLWIACRMLMDYPHNPAYQKSFVTTLNAILNEDLFTQEQKSQKNKNAKRRRLQPILASLTVMLLVMTSAIIAFSVARVSLPSAQSPVPTVAPLAVPTAAAALLFEADFETDDLSQWVNPNSIGQVVQEGDQRFLRLENNTNTYVLFSLNHAPWANSEAEVWVRIARSAANSTDFFMNLRNNPEGSYSSGLDVESSTANLLAAINGNFTDLGKKTVSLGLNQWVKVGLRTVDDQIDLYFNERLIRSATNSYHLAGALSVSIAPGTRIDLDHIRVMGS